MGWCMRSVNVSLYVIYSLPSVLDLLCHSSKICMQYRDLNSHSFLLIVISNLSLIVLTVCKHYHTSVASYSCFPEAHSYENLL